MITDRSFANMFARTDGLFRTQAERVHTQRWQGGDISKRPDMVSYELRHWHCNVPLGYLSYGKAKDFKDIVAQELSPNLPWADDHFLERVGGEPLNPGVQWANWPWASSAEKHQVEGAIFNHTYMERLWPKWARKTDQGRIGNLEDSERYDLDARVYPGQSDYFIGMSDGNGTRLEPHRGIAHPYGDLQSLIELLAKEPDTRQAWIPLFFPEDTGIGDGGRKPCTLGYQFMMRNNQLDVYYPLRSCDYIRHFRDDIYMAIRLLLWVLGRCREINPKAWNDVVPGYYVMHCTSLHIFENDYRKLMEQVK